MLIAKSQYVNCIDENANKKRDDYEKSLFPRLTKKKKRRIFYLLLYFVLRTIFDITTDKTKTAWYKGTSTKGVKIVTIVAIAIVSPMVSIPYIILWLLSDGMSHPTSIPLK